MVPQSPTRIGGKVLGIDRDSRPAASDAAPQGFDPRIFKHGHRNPQGIALNDPVARALISAARADPDVVLAAV